MTFLLNYQPELSFPPFKPNLVHAQTEASPEAKQEAKIEAGSVPIAFQLPHPGYISTRFSSYHPGIDIPTGLGMPIKPLAKGVVSQAGFNFWGLGLTVTVDHEFGYQSIYAHMGKVYVQKGQTVSETDFIGEVGMTGNTSGPHTHLEISKNGSNIDPLAVLPKMRSIPEESDFKPVGGAKQIPVISQPKVVKSTPKAPVVKPAVPTSTPKPIEIKKENLNQLISTAKPQTAVKPKLLDTLSLLK